MNKVVDISIGIRAGKSSPNAGTFSRFEKSARGLAHSKTLSCSKERDAIRQVLECASPLALSPRCNRQNWRADRNVGAVSLEI